MFVKGKYLIDAQIFHNHKACTIGEAKSLVGVFFKQVKGGGFLLGGNAGKDGKFLGIKILGDFNCQLMRNPASDQRDRFVNNEIGGKKGQI